MSYGIALVMMLLVEQIKHGVTKMFSDKKRDIENLIDELIFHESDKNCPIGVELITNTLRYCDENGLEVPNAAWSREPR